MWGKISETEFHSTLKLQENLVPQHWRSFHQCKLLLEPFRCQTEVGRSKWKWGWKKSKPKESTRLVQFCDEMFPRCMRIHELWCCCWNLQIFPSTSYVIRIVLLNGVNCMRIYFFIHFFITFLIGTDLMYLIF